MTDEPVYILDESFGEIEYADPAFEEFMSDEFLSIYEIQEKIDQQEDNLQRLYDIRDRVIRETDGEEEGH